MGRGPISLTGSNVVLSVEVELSTVIKGGST